MKQLSFYLCLLAMLSYYGCADHSSQGHEQPPAGTEDLVLDSHDNVCAADTLVPQDSAEAWISAWQAFANVNDIFCVEGTTPHPDRSRYISANTMRSFMDPDGDGENNWHTLRAYFAAENLADPCFGTVFANVDDNCNDVTEGTNTPYLYKGFETMAHLDTLSASEYYQNGMSIFEGILPSSDFTLVNYYSFEADTIWAMLSETHNGEPVETLIFNFSLREANCQAANNGQPYCQDGLEGTFKYVDMVIQPKIGTEEGGSEKANEFVNFAFPCPHYCDGKTLL